MLNFDEEVFDLGTSEEYKQWRIIQGVGEGEGEIPTGETLLSSLPFQSP